MKIRAEHDIPAGLYVRTEVLIDELSPERVLQLFAEGKVVAGAKYYPRKRAAAADVPNDAPLTEAEQAELNHINRELEADLV